MTTSISLHAAGRSWAAGTCRWIPWAIVACFVVVFAVNGGLIYFALSTWPGLETDHAYEDGIGYNKVIEADERQAKLGWSLGIEFVSAGKGSNRGTLVVDARDRDGRPLDGLTFKAKLMRPVGAVVDLPVALAPREDGRYAAAIAVPSAGQWDVYLVARRDGQVYRTGRRILAQ